MLTLKQITEITFGKSRKNGYSPEEVDKFIDEITETFKLLAKENQTLKSQLIDLKNKATELAEENISLKDKSNAPVMKSVVDEDEEANFQNILIKTQKLSAEAIREAKARAEKIVVDAQRNADALDKKATEKFNADLMAADNKIKQKTIEYNRLKAEVTVFRDKILMAYKQHVAAVNDIPDYSRELEVAQYSKPEEVKPTSQAEVKAAPVEKKVNIEQIAQNTPELTTDPEILADKFQKNDEIKNENITKDTLNQIDFSKIADLPPALNENKQNTFNTLEFGNNLIKEKTK